MPELTNGIDTEVRELDPARILGFEEGEGAEEMLEGTEEARGWGVEGEFRKTKGLEEEESFEDGAWDAGLAVSEYFLNAISKPSSE